MASPLDEQISRILVVLFIVEYQHKGLFFFFFLFFILSRGHFSLLLEQEEGRERNIDAREKYLPVASCEYLDWGSYAGVGDQTRNPGTFSDWELNLQPLSYRTALQPTKPLQPGQ